MLALSWKIRPYLKEFKEDERGARLAVLIDLMLRANHRLRCWPSMETIAADTGYSLSTVTEAKKWLLAHGAIMLVPFKMRMEAEKELPKRQHVYQLTGMVIVSTGEKVPYLVLNPDAQSALEILLSEISLTEILLSGAKGITSLKGNSKKNVACVSGDSAAGKPASKGSKSKSSKTDEPRVTIVDKNGKEISITVEEKRIRDLTDTYIKKGVRLSMDKVNGSYAVYKKHVTGLEKLYGRIEPAELDAAYDDFIADNPDCERPQAYERMVKMLDRRRQKSASEAKSKHVCPLCEGAKKVWVTRPDADVPFACPNVHTEKPLFTSVIFEPEVSSYYLDSLAGRAALYRQNDEWIMESDSVDAVRAENYEAAVAAFVQSLVAIGA